MKEDQKHLLLLTVKKSLAELAGQDLSGVDAEASFFELGFDSLLLTQAAATLKRKFRVKLTFRQLMEELTSLNAVTDYIAGQMRPEAASVESDTAQAASPAAPLAASHSPKEVVSAPATVTDPAKEIRIPQQEPGPRSGAGISALERVMKEQLTLMARQLEMLRRVPELPPAAPTTALAPSLSTKTEPKAFGPYRPINTRDARDASACGADGALH
jgi:acyl carrier protein